MRKLIRNILLLVFLISFLVIPAYSEPSKVEHPIIVIAAGEPMPEYTYFIRLLDVAGVKADVLYDLHTRVAPELFGNFSVVEEIESGKYKTVIFLFGTMNYETYIKDTTFPALVNIREVIENLKYKIDLCKQNGVRMIGLQFYFGEKYLIDTNYSHRIIEEIVPSMDLLMVFYTANHLLELRDKFVEVGKANEIPIEYFASSEASPSTYGSIAKPELWMRFGE